ncbi:TlyA family RNA methyltransferase [Niveibacterium sp. SC-1]|uniref:TlyA family RNA methyltransferase n=1 Tax=Niveibacterium sp. SC-1 TaxID=3135646 RepID=UPI00311E4250
MSMNSFHSRNPRKPATTAPTATAAARFGTRADQVLVERGLASSRTAAQKLIAAGRVSVQKGATWSVLAKASDTLPADVPLRVAEDANDRFVSRGGTKLAGALARTGVAVTGLECLDLGQSTGGFSDCLLQACAARVVGVEVGHDQLHPRLADDPRCITLEGLNARALTAADLGEHFPQGGFDLVTGDLSFISLTLVLPAAAPLLKTSGVLLMLVKPQFEVGPQGVGKGGLVRDPSLYAEVEAKIRASCSENGLAVRDYFDSSITGGDGNREFFVLAERRPNTDMSS